MSYPYADEGDSPENTVDNPESVAAWRRRAQDAEAALSSLVASLSLNDEEGLAEHAEPMQQARAVLDKARAESTPA
jgi:hypothetical protein